MNASDDTPHALNAMRFFNFRLLIFGRLAGQIGEMMVSIGVGWELYERTNDAFALGLVGLVQVVPVILLSLIGGYIADTYSRKLITLISQLVLVACSLGLMVISLTEAPLPIFYGVLALIGVARAFNNPAEAALTPQTVPPEYYFNAATWSSGVWQISAITGPALGGLLIALTHSAVAVYLANVVGGLIFVVALLFIRVKAKNAVSTPEPPLQSLREGIRFLQDTPVILASITLDMFAVLFGGAVFLLPVFAKDVLGVDAVGLGILRAAPSVGALSMAFFLSRRVAFKRAGRVLLWAVAGFGIATIGFGLSQSFWLSVFFLFLTGALDNISVVIRHTLVLTRTPDAMRGRVNAVNMIFIGASNELGGFESGLMASLLGAVGSVVFGGIGTLAVVGLVAWKSKDLRELNQLEESQALA
jgi:MFS family permease